MATIKVNDVAPRKQYIAAGGDTVFDIPWTFYNNEDLKVYLTPAGNTPDDAADLLAEVTDYTVIGAGVDDPGVRTITLVTPAAAGDLITIQGDIPIKRLTDFNDGDFSADILNQDLDNIYLIMLQLEEYIQKRMFLYKQTVNLGGVDLSMPEPVPKGTIRWNAAADALETAVISDDYVTLLSQAQTAASDAQTSAANAATSEAGAAQAAADAVAPFESRFSAGGLFWCHEQATPDMTVLVDAGNLDAGGAVIAKGPQTSPTITAPTTNPRIDRIAVSSITGDLVVVTGTEAASPTPPDYDPTHIALAQVSLQTTTTAITDSIITDERGIRALPDKSTLTSAVNQTVLYTYHGYDDSIAGILDMAGRGFTGLGRETMWLVGKPNALRGYSTLLYSEDGYAWNNRSHPKDVQLNAMVWSATLQRLVAVGRSDGTDAYIITDIALGGSWTERANPKPFGLEGIAEDGGLLVAVGEADGTDAYILTATSVATWTERANPKNFTLYAVATDGAGTWVAVGAWDGVDAYIVRSTDGGVTWTEQANSANNGLRAIHYADGLFVAVGQSGNIATSSDGVTWSVTRPLQINLLGVAYGGGVWMAVGTPVLDGNINPGTGRVISTDGGVTWEDATKYSERYLTANALVYSPARRRFIEAGANIDATKGAYFAMSNKLVL